MTPLVIAYRWSLKRVIIVDRLYDTTLLLDLSTHYRYIACDCQHASLSFIVSIFLRFTVLKQTSSTFEMSG